MRFLFPFVFLPLIILGGCATKNHSMIQATSLAPIGDAVDQAKKNILEKKYPEALKNLDEAKRLLAEKQNQIILVTNRANEVVDRLNYLEPKVALQDKAIWKRNWIILGLLISCAGLTAWIFRKQISALALLCGS